MDSFFKNMDFPVKHWAPFPRKFPSPFPVISADLTGSKDHWVRRAFDTCNFSLILRGRGEFWLRGKRWVVQAPCVITQWPGEFVEYGPPVPDETWDELYITYAAKVMTRFRQCRLVELERPVWPIGDPAAVHAQIAELAELAQSSTPEAVVDRVDRVCERLLLETHLAPQAAGEMDRAIHKLAAEVRRDLRKTVDLEKAAARCGMSPSTFRRRWAAVHKVAPARYLQQLRMREACRLLVETSQPIHEIAWSVGFEDELYFSRRFRQEMQAAPRDYRKTFQLRHLGG